MLVKTKKAKEGFTMEQKYFNTKEIAEMYSLNTNTLRCWRYQSKGPRYFKIGQLVRYTIPEVDAFMEEHFVKTTEMDGLLEK